MTKEKERKDMECKYCGCTDKKACKGGCFWIARNVCSNPICMKKYNKERTKGIVPIQATCPYCGYRWENLSGLIQIGCPSCGRRFPNPRFKEDNKIEKKQLHCNQCGYGWHPKKKVGKENELPVECPNCKSRDWNKGELNGKK